MYLEGCQTFIMEFFFCENIIILILVYNNFGYLATYHIKFSPKFYRTYQILFSAYGHENNSVLTLMLEKTVHRHAFLEWEDRGKCSRMSWPSQWYYLRNRLIIHLLFSTLEFWYFVTKTNWKLSTYWSTNIFLVSRPSLNYEFHK